MADAGRPLRRARRRPAPLVVGGRAARARAHEARAPPPSVPREVRPAARRGAPRALRSPGRPRPRPVRRIGDHARAVPRVRIRRGRRRRRRVQLPADAREDRRVRPRPARDRSPRRLGSNADDRVRRATGYVREWFAPDAAAELLHFRSIVDDYEHADVLRVVLARAARSARLTTHFDLDFPRAPQREPYWCHKHRRTCTPVQEAGKFLSRYLLDTLERLKAFQRVRTRGRTARGRPRRLDRGRPRGVVRRDRHVAAVPGLIDYHEQHRYAYEILGLDDRRERELGRRGPGRAGARSRTTSTASPRCSRAARRSSSTARPCSSSSTTAETSIPRSSRGAASGSSTGSSGTSTAGRAGARASTSSRFWSVYEKRKRSVGSDRDRPTPGVAWPRRHEKGVYDMRKLLRRPSPAMIVACLALLVALGGTSVAAVSQLARNSVGHAAAQGQRRDEPEDPEQRGQLGEGRRRGRSSAPTSRRVSFRPARSGRRARRSAGRCRRRRSRPASSARSRCARPRGRRGGAAETAPGRQRAPRELPGERARDLRGTSWSDDGADLELLTG